MLESTIRRPVMPPKTRPRVSTTAAGSVELPILPVGGGLVGQVVILEKGV